MSDVVAPGSEPEWLNDDHQTGPERLENLEAIQRLEEFDTVRIRRAIDAILEHLDSASLNEAVDEIFATTNKEIEEQGNEIFESENAS